MNPTPPTTPGNGGATLMAEIERIAQELRAYNNRPLVAIEYPFPRPALIRLL
ncbi:hypothetical protein [Hymenobacter rubripertinctus]|uniref:hypothetical protein n=1 Tax=Hymenobacter rubripertinctus TaxID=2029981 RepID=UPI001601B7B0|nr:hypothetical protein [Hymenobacter rubripertinctus]